MKNSILTIIIKSRHSSIKIDINYGASRVRVETFCHLLPYGRMFRCESCNESFAKQYDLFRHRQSRGHIQKESEHAALSQDDLLLNLDVCRNDIGSSVHCVLSAEAHKLEINENHVHNDFSDSVPAISGQNEQNEDEFQHSEFPDFQEPPLYERKEWFPFDNQAEFFCPLY